MDLDKELNDLLGSNKDANLSKLSHITHALKTNNDCESRRELKEVNKTILKNTMHEWTTTIENEMTGETKGRKVIEICKPGEYLQNKKSMLSTDGTLGSEIRRILFSDTKKPANVNSEDKFVDEIDRLQKERMNRMKLEHMMSKNRMGKKIKSKNYHRHAKRREMKEYMKKDEHEGGADSDKFQDKMDQLDKERARERISLKHKTGGRFAKIQKLRAKYDPNAREALNAMRDKGAQLTGRTRVDLDSDDDDEEEQGEIEEEEEELSDASQDDEQGEMVASGAGEMRNSSGHKKRSFVEELGTGVTAKRTRAGPVVASVISTSAANLMQLGQAEDDEDEEGSGLLRDEARFKDAIYQVYQQDDDELAHDFDKDKAELVGQERPEDVQLFQPGWGSWTGTGYEAADKRRLEKGLIRAPDTQRKDKKKTRVWIRQGVHDGLKKHLIKSVPYPYNTVEQFNVSRKELVSGIFNMQTVHRNLIKPKFHSKAGQHIYPIQKQDKVTDD